MKSDELYGHLRELAERLAITVEEHSFKNARVQVKSGLCRVKGQWVYVMDRHLSAPRKNRLLGTCLAGRVGEGVYVLPAVRDYIDRLKGD
jgi:hypothetical protein